MPDKQRVGRFLRALLGTLTVASTVVAVSTPQSVLVFTALLVPAWLLATAAAAWLVYGGGYGRLVDSRLYRPRGPAPRAVLVFAAAAVALKLLLTAAGDFLFGAWAIGDPEGVAYGIVASLAAYLLVYVVGLLGMVRPTPERVAE